MVIDVFSFRQRHPHHPAKDQRLHLKDKTFIFLKKERKKKKKLHFTIVFQLTDKTKALVKGI